MTRTVVFILSHIYSGSTWLSLLLGSHSRAFYLGEINKFYSNKDPMSCSLCDELSRTCPYFNDVHQIFYGDIHHLLFERTGKEVLVDNSKRVKWSRKLLNDDRYRHKYIHLIKDPRAVYYSLVSRNRAPELTHWTERNLEIHQFISTFKLDAVVLTYNELAEQLDASLTGLCDWIGLNYEPVQKSYWNVEHHGPGNSSATRSFLPGAKSSDQQFYDDQRRTNFVDLRWREKLDTKVMKSIETDPEVNSLLQSLRLEFSETGLRKVYELAGT